MASIKNAKHEISGQPIESLKIALGSRLVAVILFGSQAREEASAGSDWDLLVIAEGLPERYFDRHLFLKRLLPPRWRGAVSLLAKTPEEFEAHLPSLYLDIALDGQILYDPRGYAVERLTALKNLIEEAGLYRERTESGDVWRWQKEPSGPRFLEWKK